MSGEEGGVLRSLFSVQRAERRAVGLAVAAFFCLLFAIFLLRPLRDVMGLQGGARNLKYLWSLTLVGTVVASLAFAHVSSVMPRRRFMAWAYRGIALLWVALLPAVATFEGELGVFFARAFYVLHAVSNVFIVSIFWALLADVFDSGQSRRLFGLVAVGGTLGAIAGTTVIDVLSESFKAEDENRVLSLSLAVVAALFLELGLQLAGALGRETSRAPDKAQVADARLGGSLIEGLTLVAQRPYLQGIAVFTFLHGVLQTIFTLQQNFVVEHEITEKALRTEYFAETERWAQTLTLLVQLFVTGHLMRWLGVGGALLVLPIVALGGCAGMLWHEELGIGALTVVTVTLIAWRGLSHSAMRPAREALFVPTARAEKYKAKSFTDTFAFRGGDLASAFLQGAGSMASIAFFGLGLAVAWGTFGSLLARAQKRLVGASREAGARRGEG
ncbi:MAG: hypothetical protein HUU28_03600 [Planctomycetaceae bacterium]|nr:hypothetical protein [Planctomycetaceae bacterium]